jgi:hypothetical protein
VEDTSLVPLLIGAIGTMATALGILWRQSVSESKRKDALIDLLLEQVSRNADATEKVVDLGIKREALMRRTRPRDA